MNHGSTAWCNAQAGRLSTDGTTEFLATISTHPRISVIQKQCWDSKDEMCNSALKLIQDPCILLQADSDEIWSPQQISGLLYFFSAYPNINCARFFCRYFLGANIIATSTDGYGNRHGEWMRAWRYSPGMRFASHEPPVMKGVVERCASREQTKEAGLVFDHYAYATLKQIQFKEKFYGYKDACRQWNNLQRNRNWPVNDLKKFLPWVGDGASANQLHTP